jgi:uncharacterized protein (TIGR03382 family)
MPRTPRSIPRSCMLLLVLVALPAAASVPIAKCRPGDNRETVLQGMTATAERTSGATDKGFNCNTDLIGQFEGEGSSYGFAWFDKCAYYSTANLSQQQHKGVVVLDVSDSTKPKVTTYLTTAGMSEPWESLKVHEGKKYLAGVQFNALGFDVYDISGDCTQPKLLSSVVMPVGIGGHAGNFSADGLTYYASQLSPVGRIYPIDISDPAHPKSLQTWSLPNGQALHDLTLSPDGTRMYLTQIGNSLTGSANGLLIMDVSDIQKRVATPQYRIVSLLTWTDGATAQQAIQINYNGKKHLLFTDEHGSGGSSAKTNVAKTNACAKGLPPNGFARIIDISDEAHPQVISKLMLEASDPANCPVVLANVPDVISSSSHYCNVDRVDNPTIAACTYREAGLRIFNIADPLKPKEIGYYKPRARRNEVRAGSVFWGPQYAAGAERSVDQSSSNVRIVNGNEFWFTSHDNAFQVVHLDTSATGGGCSSAGGSGAVVLLGLLALGRRRKLRA